MPALSYTSAEGPCGDDGRPFDRFGSNRCLNLSEKKTETALLRTPNQALRTSPLVIEVAEKCVEKDSKVLHLGGLVNGGACIARDMK